MASEWFSHHLILRDEIQRIKAGNPDISHREAFSAAAKNVRSKDILNLTLLGTFPFSVYFQFLLIEKFFFII